MATNLVKINARDCICKKITNDESCNFLDKYHLQKSIITPINYGLFYNNDLVQVMTFGIDRFGSQARNIKYEYEMVRECSKSNYQIRGGKSKLLKYFIKDYNPCNIISYCSKELGFDGHSYFACGFKLVREQKRSYHYEKDGKIYSRFQFQKNSNLRKQNKKEPIQRTIESINGVYDFNLTEYQNAINNGFIKIQEAGNLVFELLLRDFTGYVYKTTNTINNKIYIGQHFGEYDPNYLGSGTMLRSAIEKYGRDNFTNEILEKVQDKYFCNFQNKLNKAEIKYIAKFDSQNTDTGYNISAGGQNDGYLASRMYHNYDDYKKAMSNKLRERYKDPEYKENIRQKTIERNKDPEYKLRMSNIHKQTWQDNEIRERRIDARKKANTIEYCKKISIRMKNLCKDPEYMKKRTEKMKATKNTAESKKNRSEKARKSWEKNKERRKRLSEKMKNLCKDPEYMKKRIEKMKATLLKKKESKDDKN